MLIRTLSMLGALCLATTLSAQPVNRLADGDSELQFDPSATTPLTARSGNYQFAPPSLWKLILQKPGKPWLASVPVTIASGGQSLKSTSSGKELRVITESLKIEDAEVPVRVDLSLKLESGGFVGSIEITNNSSDWLVREVQFTGFSGATVTDDEPRALLWPNGLGQRYESPAEFGKRTFNYPSGGGTMQWIALAGAENGLYLASHDPARGAKVFQVEWKSPKTINAQINHLAFCAPGGKYKTAPVIFKSYAGSWHAAARIYRAWFESAVPAGPQPEWLKSQSGWLLAVLKQQSGEVLWDYQEIDRLCDLADAHGLDGLGLFGWAHGGHDKFFPEFAPDPLMGGPSGLKAAIARAKARGKKTILYANGIMMDVTTGFYAQQGNEVALLKESQELNVTSVRKFSSTPPVTFAMACPGADAWRDQLLALAMQAQKLGADGILFDQLGTGDGGVCYAPNHRHGKSGAPVGPQRFSMVAEIAKRMREIDPNFVIATEGMTDGLFESVGFFHGWGTGFASEKKAGNDAADMFQRGNDFPQLLRYTFPDWTGTIRHATPALDAGHASHAVLLGIGLEIEGRYQPDKAYLERGVVPSAADYADVTYYPPDLQLLSSITPARALEISQKTSALRRRNADTLMQGKFLDVEGIKLEGEGVAASVFQSKSGERAVVLVNRTDESREFTLKTDFGMPTGAENIDKSEVAPLSTLAPRECRVLHFKP